MVLERKLMKMVHVMWEYSRMEREMVKEHTLSLIEESMLGNGRMGNIMIREHGLSLMEESMLESSKKVDLGTLLTTIKTETSHTKSGMEKYNTNNNHP